MYRYMTTIIALVFIALMFFGLCRVNVFASGKRVSDRATNKKVVDLINRARSRGVKCGEKYYRAIRSVVWSETLGQASLRHSMLMASRGLLFHTRDYSGGRGDRLLEVGYSWRAYGENVGEGYYTPEALVEGWLKSPDHCRNIMNPVFEEAGSSYAQGSGRIYWTLMLAAPGKRSDAER